MSMKDTWQHQNNNELIIEVPISTHQAGVDWILNSGGLGSSSLGEVDQHLLEQERNMVKLRLRYRDFQLGASPYLDSEKNIYLKPEEALQLAYWLINRIEG